MKPLLFNPRLLLGHIYTVEVTEKLRCVYTVRCLERRHRSHMLAGPSDSRSSVCEPILGMTNRRSEGLSGLGRNSNTVDLPVMAQPSQQIEDGIYRISIDFSSRRIWRDMLHMPFRKVTMLSIKKCPTVQPRSAEIERCMEYKVFHRLERHSSFWPSRMIGNSAHHFQRYVIAPPLKVTVARSH